MGPIIFNWDGETFAPLNRRFAIQCDRQFVVGETYPLVVQEARSQASHSHYFAALHEAWSNLPEAEAQRFMTAEHLRKWALIKSGFADERSIVCASKAEAQRVAAWARPFDEYAVVIVSDATVKQFTAQSQSLKAMGREQFQRSKTAVLEIVAGMIGVSPDVLSSEAKRSAA